MIPEEKKREIEVLLDEFERDLREYQAFMAEWRERNSGFRCIGRTYKDAAE